MKTRVPLLALAILLTIAASASAQYRGGTVELNPFAGYLFGGRFGDFDFDDDFDHGDRPHLEVDDDAVYGGRVGYNFTNLWQMELEYAQSDTSLDLDLRNAPDERLVDLRFQYFMGYLTLNFGQGRFVPYFTIGSGAADLRARASDASTSTDVRYTSAIGGGVKIFFIPHFGLRFDGRVYSTYLGDSTVVCGPGVLCSTSNWVTNVVANGGLLFAF
jgi:hypothetical protein